MPLTHNDGRWLGKAGEGTDHDHVQVVARIVVVANVDVVHVVVVIVVVVVVVSIVTVRIAN